MKLKRLALFLVAAVLPVIVYTVKAQTNTVYDPAPLDTIYPIHDDSAKALVALAAMYAPMESEEEWAEMVCIGMTKGGCDYFKQNQAPGLWKSQSSNIGSSSGFIANIQSFDENTQFWKARVTVFTPGKETTSDVFAVVRRDTNGSWYLDRILSGPGVALP